MITATVPNIDKLAGTFTLNGTSYSATFCHQNNHVYVNGSQVCSCGFNELRACFCQNCGTSHNVEHRKDSE